MPDSSSPHNGDQRLIDEDASTLYHEAPCGYLYTRPDGTLLRVNARFLTWTGYERSELIGRRLQDLLTIGGRIYHETHFGPLLHMQGFVSEIALEIVTKSGALLPVLVNSVQKRDQTGKPVLNRTTLFNASERKKYERELQVARKRAEESARAKSELLATISHDMRSPLGAILGSAQLLSRSELTGPQRVYVRILRSSSEMLLNLINSVLDLNKIESGRVTLDMRPFDLRQLVLDLLASLNIRAEEKRLTLRVAIDDEVPGTVIGDPVKIGQVLTNLVANAVKFTETGTVAVTVKARRLTAQAVDLEFSVADTGIGIPADRLQHIFDDFNQAGEDVGATYGGYGLGLGIVRRLLALHGSKISLESVVGRGSTFWFSLTLELAPDGVVPQGDTGSNDGLVDARLLDGTRVLLVEDNTFDTFMLGRSLAAWGVKFDVCQSVSDAVATTQANHYDAVLLSARLANGAAEAARAIRKAALDLSPPPVLALGALRTDDLEHLTQDLIADVIPKPVDPSVLFAKLAALRT